MYDDNNSDYNSNSEHEHFKEVIRPFLEQIKDKINENGSAVLTIYSVKDLTDTNDRSNAWVFWLLKSILWHEAGLEVFKSKSNDVSTVIFKKANKDYKIPDSLSKVTGYVVDNNKLNN